MCIPQERLHKHSGAEWRCVRPSTVRVSELVIERIVVSPVPQFLEVTVEVANLAPQDMMQQWAVEQIRNVPVPQVMET